MSITAGKRGHVNICASAFTVSLPVFSSPVGTEEGILLSLVCIKFKQDLCPPPLSYLIFTNSGKQLVLKLIHFSTTSRGKSSQITTVKLLWYALYFPSFNVKKNCNIQVQGGEEEKEFEAQLFVTGVRQGMEEITQNWKGIWGFPDTKVQELVEDNLATGKLAVLEEVRIFTNWESKWFSVVWKPMYKDFSSASHTAIAWC